MSSKEAILHEPNKPTYAIRIFSSPTSDNGRDPLRNSDFYRKIVEYVFEDTDPFIFQAGQTIITSEIARSIVSDFAEHKNSIEALAVHCYFGKNRSPAVAISLNEIFGLGANSKELKQKFNEYNRYVYDTLMEAGLLYLRDYLARLPNHTS